MASKLDDLLPAIISAGDSGLSIGKISEKFAGKSKAKESATLVREKLSALVREGAIWGPFKFGPNPILFCRWPRPLDRRRRHWTKYAGGRRDRSHITRAASQPAVGELQRAKACNLAIQTRRTTCHLYGTVVAARSPEDSVPASRSRDQTRTATWRHCARPLTPRPRKLDQMARSHRGPVRANVQNWRSSMAPPSTRPMSTMRSPTTRR